MAADDGLGLGGLGSLVPPFLLPLARGRCIFSHTPISASTSCPPIAPNFSKLKPWVVSTLRPRHRREAVRSPGGMSLDSDSSSQGGDRRSFRQITRDRNHSFCSPPPPPLLIMICLPNVVTGTGPLDLAACGVEKLAWSRKLVV